ncbi:Hypothetical_protein [Hexamita inflata]|uniref:Hypothetical_protein n=1 Tax=Hexamita inflata TaxID=28002 RepID=A0AA86RDK4_9EUKA|nr:Hypothetical protein HINF_LOCUS63260 [Hexamita inflata]
MHQFQYLLYRLWLKKSTLINIQCMIRYQQRKCKVTTELYIFTLFKYSKFKIADCATLKQQISIIRTGVKEVHVTNDIQFIDSNSSRYGSQNTKMQQTLIIAVKPSSPESK